MSRLVICSNPACQTTAGCKCNRVSYVGTATVPIAKLSEVQEQSEPGFGDSILTKRPIPHDEAREAMQRLVNSHFNNPRDTHEHGRMSIPANPDRDDDLVLSAYIRQQRAKEPAPIGAPNTATFTYLGQSVTLDPSDFSKYVEDRKTLNLMLLRLDAEASERARKAARALNPAQYERLVEGELRDAMRSSS